MPLKIFAFFAALVPATAAAQDGALTAAARQVLAGLQGPSFEAGREFCGLLGLDRAGRLVATKARRGRVDGCTPVDSLAMTEVLASYHTHGSFDADADAEVPSLDDLLADMNEGLDGYVSTPGGRFWFVDGARGEVRLICDRGCLPVDPRFVPGIAGPIRSRYDRRALEARERQF